MFSATLLSTGISCLDSWTINRKFQSSFWQNETIQQVLKNIFNMYPPFWWIKML